jgi:hypothetical protein
LKIIAVVLPKNSVEILVDAWLVWDQFAYL